LFCSDSRSNLKFLWFQSYVFLWCNLCCSWSGDPNNPDPSNEQLYVKLNNSKIVYDGDAANLTAGVWTQWEIDLDEFGIGLSNVTQLVIGMEKTGATGGTEGIMFLDDIRLYQLSQ